MRFGDRPANHRASWVTTLTAAAVAVVILGVLVYLAAVAPRGVPTVGYVDVDAAFADTAELKLLSSVTVNGKRVGQVSEITNDGRLSRLNLQLDPGTELLADTTARIRVKNPVGARYVDLAPGTSGQPLRDGDSIPVEQTSTAVDTPDLLATFDAPTRDNLSGTVTGLGKGFLGRGQEINEVLPKGPGVLRDSNAVAKAILGREGAADRFFPSLETLSRAYEPVRDELATGFSPQAKVFEALVAEQDSLRADLSALPPFLSETRAGLDRTRPFLAELTGFSQAVSRFSRPAPAAFRQATRLLTQGGPDLRAARPLLTATGNAVRPTLRGLRALRPTIRPTIDGIADQLPVLRQLKLQQCDIFFQARVWRSALSFGVPGRADPTSDLDELQGIGPNQNSFRVLTVDPALEAVGSDFLTTRPPGIEVDQYPAPCAAPNNEVGP